MIISDGQLVIISESLTKYENIDIINNSKLKNSKCENLLANFLLYVKILVNTLGIVTHFSLVEYLEAT